MSGNQENIKESDKEKMKTFLNTIYKQIPVFSGNPDDLDHFLDCIQKVESPSLKETLFAMIRTKLQGPAGEAVQDKQFESLEELRAFLVSNFKSPGKAKKVCKSPQASTSKVVENGVEGGINIQQNVIDSTQEPPVTSGKSNQISPKKAEASPERKPKIKTEKIVKVEKSSDSENPPDGKAKKDMRDIPKSERKVELLNLLKNKKLLQLVEDSRRENMKDAWSQTDDTNPKTTDKDIQTNNEVEVPSEITKEVPSKVMKDQKCQTVRRCTKIIKNYITVNIHHPGGNSISSDIKKEIIENLDKSLLKGTKDGESSSRTESEMMKDSKRTNEGETSDHKNEETCEMKSLETKKTDESTNKSEKIPDVETKPLGNESKPGTGLTSEEIKAFLTNGAKDQNPERKADSNDSGGKPDKFETKTEEKPTGSKSKNTYERSNNITLTGSRKRSRESERTESDKRYKAERRSPKSKRFADGYRKSDLYCHYCQKRGHTKDDCRNRIRDSLFCEYCVVTGHSDSQCKEKAYANLSQPLNFVNNDNACSNDWNFSSESYSSSCYNQARNETFNFNSSRR